MRVKLNGLKTQSGRSTKVDGPEVKKWTVHTTENRQERPLLHFYFFEPTTFRRITIYFDLWPSNSTQKTVHYRPWPSILLQMTVQLGLLPASLAQDCPVWVVHWRATVYFQDRPLSLLWTIHFGSDNFNFSGLYKWYRGALRNGKLRIGCTRVLWTICFAIYFQPRSSNWYWS